MVKLKFWKKDDEKGGQSNDEDVYVEEEKPLQPDGDENEKYRETKHNDIENGGDRYSGRDTNSDIGSASTRKHQITYSMADEIKAEEDPRMRHATTVDMIELGIRNKNGSSSGPQDKLAREKRRRDLEDYSDEESDFDDERTRRQTKKKKKKDKYVGEYGSTAGGAYEPNFSLWCKFKAVTYFTLFIVGMVLLAEDYNLKECTEIDSFGYCVKYEDLKRCVSSSDSECYTQCVTDGKTISLNPGCRKTLKTDGTTNITTCYTESNFYTACYDSTSCHSSNIYPVEVVLTLVVALLCVTAVCEFLYAVSLGRFAGYHPNDFQESQDDSSTALLYINRNMGKILQYGLCLMIVLMLFLVYASVTSGSTCSDAQTVQGEQYEFFDWALTYLTILSVIVPIFIIIGTIARFMMPFRGELYNPAFHGEGELPDLVDCGIWRYRARGSRCGNCNTLYNMGFKRTSALCAWLVDAFFCYCLCGQCIGWGIENSYKYRHYIGT